MSSRAGGCRQRRGGDVGQSLTGLQQPLRPRGQPLHSPVSRSGPPLAVGCSPRTPCSTPPSPASVRGIVSTASCGGEECGRALQNIHATGGPAWTRWAAPGTRPVDGASADAAPAAAAVAALGAAATVSQRQWEGLRWPSRALRWSGARYTRREERPAGLCARGLGSTRQRWRRMENQWTSGRRRRVSPSHERIRPSRQRDEPPGGLDVHIPLAKIP